MGFSPYPKTITTCNTDPGRSAILTLNDLHPFHKLKKMSQSKSITVLYFAAASSATGTSQEEISLPDNREFKLSDLPQVLVSRYPNSNLGEILKISRWSVDLEMVDEPDQITLNGGEEVGVICPVSGG
jgi:molybdopterin converting factor small subunit